MIEGVPNTQWVDFTSATSFDVFYLSYVVSTGSGDVSGLVLETLDSPAGSAVSRLTIETSACTSADSPVTGTCNFISSSATASANSPVLEPSAVTPAFLELAAGSYRIGLYESENPSSGTISFEILADMILAE